jgi:molybdopterin molybdotransferase
MNTNGHPAAGVHTMRPIRETIPLDEALALLFEFSSPVERTERAPLDESNGRVLASPVSASMDVPPFDRAAMDGYAAIAEDTFGAGRYEPRILRCAGKIYTGEVSAHRLVRGECIEIATGAPMPEGADAVVMVEETEKAEGGDIRIFTPVYPRQHVGRRGADITTGQTVLNAGELLNPSRVGALAALGLAQADVYARPRVAILSTGNEIAAQGAQLAPGQIYDINRHTLAAVIRAHGGEAIVLPTAPDSLPDLSAAVRAAADEDMLVFSGGSSVGERDLIMDVLAATGEVIFHGIAVKPGKPTVFGRVNGKPVLGMPGYPTSCLSNAYLLLVPLLRRMARLPEHTPHSVQLPLSRRIVSTTGRHQFYTVRIANGTAVPAFKASGDITSMSQADGYIEIAADQSAVDEGAEVEVILF